MDDRAWNRMADSGMLWFGAGFNAGTGRQSWAELDRAEQQGRAEQGWNRFRHRPMDLCPKITASTP